MATRIIMWFAIAALLTVAVLWRLSDSRTLIAGLLVCAGAVVATVQATRARQYGWMAIFLVITVLFNPLVSMGFSRGALVALYLGCLATILLRLRIAVPAPRLSMVSITYRSPDSETL